VEGFIDKLADFLRGILGDDETAAKRRPPGGTSTGASGAGGQRYRDPDMQEAWEELDEYMRTGANTESKGRRQQQSARPHPPVDESLRQDYALLEVPFGADIETVRKSYKRMVLAYHPDRFGNDPEKQKIALEMSKKINESFERIRAHHEGTRSS
jgi:hypothetical protein